MNFRFKGRPKTPVEREESLLNLKPGDSATILSVRCGQELTGQLMGMGLFAGTGIKLLQGGAEKPFLLSVGETRIAMGRELAGSILIERSADVPTDERGARR